MIVAADIGGTKIHLARFEEEPGGALRRTEETVLPTAGTADPAASIGDWARRGGGVPEAVGLGVAGPVEGRRVVGTNLPWDVEADAVSRAAGGAPVSLLNDLVASAYALDDLAPVELETLQAGAPDPEANRALVSPGTGLGECLIRGRGAGLVAVGTEGGHADFGPTTEEQLDLWRFLRARHGRVTWERVVSGPGLGNVHAWQVASGRFAGDPGAAIPSDAPEAPARIAAAALDGSSPACAEALRVWCEALAAEAGNAALRANATGGVFLGGGIPAKVLPRLREPDVLAIFRDKAPQEEMLARVPLHVVTVPDLALRGAARGAVLARGSVA